MTWRGIPILYDRVVLIPNTAIIVYTEIIGIFEVTTSESYYFDSITIYKFIA